MDAPLIGRPASAKGQILFKWPERNLGKLTGLTVEPDELAVFFRDGRVERTVPPGRVTLVVPETPTELYFISMHEFANLPFGGAIDNVVDPQTKAAVGLRVFGEYSLKVIDPRSLIVNLVGTQHLLTNDKITDWMRGQLLKTLRTEVVAQIVASGWPLLGIGPHR